MASKYKDIVKTLPKLPRAVDSDEGFQAEVDKMKTEILSRVGGPPSTDQMAGMYAALRKQHDDLKETIKEINIVIEAYSQLIIAGFEEGGTTALRLATGSVISLVTEPYIAIKDPEKFRLWCIANGLGPSLKLLWSTANSLVKERLINGEPEPDGVEAFSYSKLKFHRGADEPDRD
jgi:hypothetical protein